VRAFILDRSALVVEGDSGIPLKYFAPATWNITVYGHYRVLEMLPTGTRPTLTAW